MNRLNVLVGYLICAVMFVVGVMSMRSNWAPMYANVEENISQGHTLVLKPGLSADTISTFLMRNSYVSDSRDANEIGRWVALKLRQHGGFENLGILNTPAIKMNADTAYSLGGEWLRERVEIDRTKMGLDDDFTARQPYVAPANAKGEIVVRVSNKSKASTDSIAGIAVRLKSYEIDTADVKSRIGRNSCYNVKDSILGYATTDSKGVARFQVEEGRAYSVVPMRPGYQYGQEKGTTGGLLKGKLDLSFRQTPHVLTPFDNATYQAIKLDRAMVVRTPAQAAENVNFGVAVFLVGWFLTLVFFMWRDSVLKTQTDYLMLIVIMALTGIGLLASYAINNPLIDKPNGYVMAQALLIGLVAMCAVSGVNFVKFYNGKSRLQMGVLPFDAVDKYITSRFRNRHSLSKTSGLSISSGFMYLGIALLLILCLALFGTGPEGSDARVNLGPFQPSEISKYLIIIFIAAFFAENAMLIQAFSEKLTRLTLRRHLMVVATVMAVIVALMLIYLKVLSDMGPALVLLITFIFIYSMARRDFAQLLLGMATFGILLWISSMIGLSPLMGALMWYVAWISYGWFAGHKIYESAMFINLVIIVFFFGGEILNVLGAENEAARLLNRTNMAGAGVWNNTVLGGDQVAQGLWSLSTGGFSGMGLGGGTPSLVPACHTDMVFTSIGEMLGLSGLVLVILCFVVLVHRALLIGRKAAQPFVMYLVMGIAIVTGVQFLFIVLGSLGSIPLTGISVPFLSYGRTSTIITMAFFGIILSASRVQATDSQVKYANTYNAAVASCALLFILGGLFITYTLFRYQVIDRKDTMLRPAFITNTLGERVIEYNPRINLVLNRLHSGNIYDRNGLLLATSSSEELTNNIDTLVKKAGLDRRALTLNAHKRYARYYPFGDETLFMIGDANTKQVYSYQDADPMGYLAEARHFGTLRGLSIPETKVSLNSDKYKPNRFMADTTRSFPLTLYDYDVLYDYLNYSLDDNPLIKAHNDSRKQRDIYLTFDAALQKTMQNQMELTLSTDSRLKGCSNMRASVVVLNAATGDFLCSANYPKPCQDTIIKVRLLDIYRDSPSESPLLRGHAPITQRDLGMTLQTQPGSTAKVMSAMGGLMKYGAPGADKTYTVLPWERVEAGEAEPQGQVTMRDAIVRSSNNYFINMVNTEQLYQPYLSKLYETVGARVHYSPAYRGDKPADDINVVPYFFNTSENIGDKRMDDALSVIAGKSYAVYKMNLDRRTKRDDPHTHTWNDFQTAMAWGQGYLRTSPLNMARVASIVANGGKFMPTRYVMRYGSTDTDPSQPIEILTEQAAQRLRQYMQAESDKHRANGTYLPGSPDDPNRMGGKTGTPQRYDAFSRRKNHTTNDAWYICFINSNTQKAPLAVAIRLERVANYNTGANYISSEAVRMINEIVISALNQAGYDVR